MSNALIAQQACRCQVRLEATGYAICGSKRVSAAKMPGRRQGEGTFSYRKLPQDLEVSDTQQAELCGCPECSGELEQIKEHE